MVTVTTAKMLKASKDLGDWYRFKSKVYFPSPISCFPLGNLDCCDESLASLDYPTVSHFKKWNWQHKNEWLLPQNPSNQISQLS